MSVTLILANLAPLFLALGSVSAFAWFLDDVRQLPEPIETKGALGLWEWKA